MNGIALSSDHVLCLGTSIDQTQYDNVSSNTAYNIYLTATPVSNFSEEATTVKWLTNYSGNGEAFSETNITKVNDNRFLISWKERETGQTPDDEDGLSDGILHYVFIDGKGNAISKEFTAKASISDCQPILKGNDIVYYASNRTMVNFYSINTQSGVFHKKIYRVAGENASWELKDGVLNISGTGPMSVIGFIRGSEQNAAWGPIRKKVTKIIVSGGITSISECAFSHFENLEEVEIESGVKSIERAAFSGIAYLRKITIPASVTSIGRQLFDVYGTVSPIIYAPKGSYALEYAQKYGFRSIESDGKNENENKNENGNKKESKITCDRTVYETAYGTKPFKINAVSESKMTFTSSNPKVATVNKDTGMVIIKNTGITAITIKAGNDTKKVTIRVSPQKPSVKSVKVVGGKELTIKWVKDKMASGYHVQVSTDKTFEAGGWIISDPSVNSFTLTKLKAGRKYYVRLRSFKHAGIETLYSAWSEVKSSNTIKK